MSILDKQEVSRSRVGPRELKDPHSRAYAIQTVYALKSYAESLRCDEERVAKELAEIEKYRHWEVLGYSSKQALLDAELNETGRKRIAALARSSVKQADENKKNGVSLNNNVMKVGVQGNSQSYTLRRLAREREDLFEAFERGELTANAAAIKAGFRKRMISVPAGDLAAAMRILSKHYNPTEMAIAAARLRDT
jgi:hypothetical protein